VIDFGIARTTGTDLAAGELALTTTAAFADRFLGTPEYMSPERFGTDEGDLDVRADVYALGVVLYELLAGRPPHDLRDTPLVRAITIVREHDPPPLAVGTRGLSPALAAIVGKCLAKDRRRRYGSAGEPVSARPPGAWESLLRIVRRQLAVANLHRISGLIRSGGLDRAIRIWDLDGGAGPTVLAGHTQRLESLRSAPTGHGWSCSGPRERPGSATPRRTRSSWCCRTRPRERRSRSRPTGCRS